jgi:hypothetical protein
MRLIMTTTYSTCCGAALSIVFCAQSLAAQSPGSAAPPADAARALTEVTTAETARVRGDSAAWRLLAPGFVFVHSTGAVNDRDTYLAFRARGQAAGGRTPQYHESQPPVVRIDGQTLVTIRSLAEPAAPGSQAHESRAIDVYVRRDSVWQWLAHQTAEVAPRWIPVVVDAETLDEYAGTYASADSLRRTFARRGTELVQVTAAGERVLVPLSESSFGYSGLVATVTFVRDRTGRVTAVDESAQVGFRRYRR